MAQRRQPNRQTRQHQKERGPGTTCRTLERTLRDGCLGLDMGTSATRLVYWFKDEHVEPRPYVVQHTNALDAVSRYEATDFPSAMKPFNCKESPETCIGFIDDSPDAFPVKIFLYILWVIRLRERDLPGDLEAIEKVKKRIPQLRAFFLRFDRMKKLEQDIVVAHALAIYLAHLRLVKAASEMQAYDNGIKLTELGATFPPNWNKWMQQMFIQILEKVWDTIDKDSIELIKESHAAAHWVMHLAPRRSAERLTDLVLADFGGHTFSCEPYQINLLDDGSDRFSVVSLSDDKWNTKCKHAGSELHAAAVLKKVQEDISSRDSLGSPAERDQIVQELMEDYHAKKHTACGSGKAFAITSHANVRVVFSKTEAEKLYKAYFDKGLKALQRLITSSKIKKGSIVVLTGGTFYNKHVLKAAKTMIDEAFLDCPDWATNAIVGNSRSAKIAAGAAMGLVHAGNTSDFMSKATFALRVKDGEFVTFHALLNRKKTKAFTKDFGSSQGGAIALVCSPKGLEGDIPDGPLRDDFFEDAYDFKDLGRTSKGLHKFSMTYEPKDAEASHPRDELCLTVKYPDPSDTPSELRWPIFFDRSPGLCLVDSSVEGNLQDQDQAQQGTRPRPPGLRRLNLKGEVARKTWEEDHEDSSRSCWQNVEPLEPEDLDVVLQGGEAARRALAGAVTNGDSGGQPTGMSAPRPATEEKQKVARPKRQGKKAVGAAPVPTSTEKTRKRRVTSSANKPTATRQKAVHQNTGSVAPNGSIAPATPAPVSDEMGGGAQQRPYRNPESSQQMPVTVSSNGTHSHEPRSAAEDAAMPGPSEEVHSSNLPPNTRKGRLQGIRDEERTDQSAAALQNQSPRPQSTPTVHRVRGHSPAPRLPSGQPLVSYEFLHEVQSGLNSYAHT